ncbi:HK97 gp10 family phage protein [Afipia felis]
MKRLRELVPQAEVAAAKAQEVSAKELAAAIKSRAPRFSNEYAHSIEAVKVAGRNDDRKPIGIEKTKDPNAWGIVALYIWRFIEFGARPHTIRPKKKPLLAFRIGDRLVRAGQVNHPGMKARPHIFPTYRAMKKRIRRRVAAAINKAIKKGHLSGE